MCAKICDHFNTMFQFGIARLRSVVKPVFLNYIKTIISHHALFRRMVRHFCFARARDCPPSRVHEKVVVLLRVFLTFVFAAHRREISGDYSIIQT